MMMLSRNPNILRCFKPHLKKEHHHKWTVSNLVRPINVLPHGQKEDHSKTIKTEHLSKSARLFEDQGLVRPVPNCPGLFNYLPLGMRALNKLTRLVDESMEDLNASKVKLPNLTSGELWRKTKRWDEMGKELLKFADRTEKEFVISPTHEESVTSLVAGLFPISYKNLPLKLYQISTKYRDEMKPKFGLLRSKEFLMKDLYTFDCDIDSAKHTYHSVMECYDRFFQKLGVPFHRVDGDTGAIGGTLSHEYHFSAEIGQDTILICPKCNQGKNMELDEKDTRPECVECSGHEKFGTTKSIEVGHTFLLGDKYSSVLQANFLNSCGKPQVMQMGCYGLGVSRILAASAEVLSTNDSLRWPPSIVPFSVIVLAPKFGSREYTAMTKVDTFCDRLNEKFPDDFILDDRNDVTVGKKLRESLKVGYRFIVLFGKDSIDPGDPLVEVFDVNNSNSMLKMTLEAALQFLNGQNKLGPKDVAVIREVYDNDNIEDLFLMELEKALEVKCRTIIIEPESLAEEVRKWLIIGSWVKTTSILTAVGTYVTGMYFPQSHEMVILPFGLTSAFLSSLYILSWRTDPCSRYVIQKTNITKAAGSHSKLIKNLSTKVVGPLVLIRDEKNKSSFFFTLFTFSALAFSLWRMK